MSIAARPMELPNGVTVSQLSRPETELLYREIFLERSYLPPEISLSGEDVVVDVGAHIGMASLFFLLEFPGVMVYALEPAPVPYAALTANLERFGGRVRTDSRGLGAEPGTRSFVYYPGAPGMSGFHADPGRDVRRMGEHLEARGVPHAGVERMLARRGRHEQLAGVLTTLSAVIDEAGIEEVALLKLDCEGSELDVLRGVADHQWRAIRQVAAEVEGEERCRLISAVMTRHGMAVTTRRSNVIGSGDFWMLYGVRPDRNGSREDGARLRVLG